MLGVVAFGSDDFYLCQYDGKHKQVQRERFLANVEQVVPWAGLLALIEAFYFKAGDGRLPPAWRGA